MIIRNKKDKIIILIILNILSISIFIGMIHSLPHLWIISLSLIFICGDIFKTILISRSYLYLFVNVISELLSVTEYDIQLGDLIGKYYSKTINIKSIDPFGEEDWEEEEGDMLKKKTIDWGNFDDYIQLRYLHGRMRIRTDYLANYNE